MARTVRLLAVALVAAASAAFPAAAHEEVPGVRNVLDAVEPGIPGVIVEVRVSAADQLVAENRTAQPLEVLSDTGQPFLRISVAGVEANLNAPDWYFTNQPEGRAPVPPAATPTAEARWVLVSREPSWGWFDHRLHQTKLTATPDTGVIERWVVPMRHGDTALEVRGHREFKPPAGGFRTELRGDAPDGVQVSVAPGTIPALLLVAKPGEDVELRGAADEPFARITAAGTEVNEASPTWALTAASRNEVPTGPVGAQEPPRWRVLSAQRQLTWLERRAAYPDEEPPTDVLRRTEPTTVLEWEVPLRVGAVESVIAGSTTWVPALDQEGGSGGGGGAEPPAADGSRPPYGAIAGVVAIVAAAWVLLGFGRRRSRPPGPTTRNL